MDYRPLIVGIPALIFAIYALITGRTVKNRWGHVFSKKDKPFMYYLTTVLLIILSLFMFYLAFN